MPKTVHQKNEEKLVYKRRNCYDEWSDQQINKAYNFADAYSRFLSAAKTERRAVAETIDLLRAAGFRSYAEVVKLPVARRLTTGIYFTYEDKNIIAYAPGKKSMTEGLNILLAHIDSPRIDLKPHPLYEEHGLALFNTQYYGGLKKYQWVTVPLALHGVVILGNGEKITIEIGEKISDPVFCITDILPHVSRFQSERKANDIIQGEELNVVIGSRPVTDKEVKQRVKLTILEYLSREYGMVEEDFISADIEVVPAGPAREVGMDRSMLLGYGHDDRACAYAALSAFIKSKKERAQLLFLADKEEIGSVGLSGAQSDFVPYVLGKILELNNLKGDITSILFASAAISADVHNSLDPTFTQVMDLKNSSLVNCGVVLNKYNGGRGKGMGLEVEAEYIGMVRNIFNKRNVIWQVGTFSKVDEGGGSTLAEYLAHRGVRVLDAGVGVLSMHSPYEIVSKADLYATYEAYRVFLEEMKEIKN